MITANVSIALQTESAAITVDNSQDTAFGGINVSSTQVDFNTTPAFSYASTLKVASLHVLGGPLSEFGVTGTPGSAVTTLDTGTAGSFVYVAATGAGTLDINCQGSSDSVTLGQGGPPIAGMQDLFGTINVTNVLDNAGSIDLTLDDSADTTGQTATLDDNGTTGSVTGLSPALITYTDADINSLTINGGEGFNVFNVNATSGDYPTTLNTGIAYVQVNVFATGNNALDITCQSESGSQCTVTLGVLAGFGMQDLNGTISINTVVYGTPMGPMTSFLDLVLDDSLDPTGQTATLTDNGTTGTLTGLAPATITYPDAGIHSLTIDGGDGGGNMFTLDGTPDNTSFVPTLTTLNTGSGSNNVVDGAPNAGGTLDVAGMGTSDTVSVSNGGGNVNVDGAPGSTKLVVDLQADYSTPELYSMGTTSTLLSEPVARPRSYITYTTTSLVSLEIDTAGNDDQSLAISFDGGNPIPTGSRVGLIYNAGTPVPGGSSDLSIGGELPSGGFASEVHNANDPTVTPTLGQYGSIFFTDSAGVETGLDYIGLQPGTNQSNHPSGGIGDGATVTNYTFNDFALDQSFTATDSNDLNLGFDTIQFANTPATLPPTFEMTNVANKTNIVFNTTVTGTPANVVGVVNVPTASPGLASLMFNTPTSGTNAVSFVATPPSVATSLAGGPAQDVTNVTGTGVRGRR